MVEMVYAAIETDLTYKIGRWFFRDPCQDRRTCGLLVVKDHFCADFYAKQMETTMATVGICF